MKPVGIFEGKTKFSALIAAAQRGETTVVTRNGRPVAEIGPVQEDRRQRAKAAAQRIKARRARLAAAGKLKGINIRELIYEGRK
jgi:prevent-host-death family protein